MPGRRASVHVLGLMLLGASIEWDEGQRISEKVEPLVRQ